MEFMGSEKQEEADFGLPVNSQNQNFSPKHPTRLDFQMAAASDFKDNTSNSLNHWKASHDGHGDRKMNLSPSQKNITSQYGSPGSPMISQINFTSTMHREQ